AFLCSFCAVGRGWLAPARPFCAHQRQRQGQGGATARRGWPWGRGWPWAAGVAPWLARGLSPDSRDLYNDGPWQKVPPYALPATSAALATGPKFSSTDHRVERFSASRF